MTTTTIPTDGQNLQNKVVLLSSEHYRGSDEQRLFLCREGFGCFPFCAGQAVIGKFIHDGEETRVERWQIAGIVDPQPPTVPA